MIICREKEKAEKKDQKILEILRLKDEKILEMREVCKQVDWQLAWLWHLTNVLAYSY